MQTKKKSGFLNLQDRSIKTITTTTNITPKGITDPQTGIFSADTRYNLRTHDGANILLQTSGPAQPEGGLQLRVVFETGDRDYYWLNNVVAVGVLSPAEGGGEDTFMLRIDVWHVSLIDDWGFETLMSV
jgi:hypothetical protein